MYPYPDMFVRKCRFDCASMVPQKSIESPHGDAHKRRQLETDAPLKEARLTVKPDLLRLPRTGGQVMMCGDTDGDTTQETRQRPVEFEAPSRTSSSLSLAYEVGLKLTRKKERCKMLEELKASEQDRIDILWTELEGKRQKLDDSQTTVDDLSQQLDKEKEAIVLLEAKLTSLDGDDMPDRVKQFLSMLARDAEECSSPLNDPTDPDNKEAKDDSLGGDTEREGEHETVAVQHVFDGVEGRGRGRTPKSATVTTSPGRKRGRGRPRKQPVQEEVVEAVEGVEAEPALPKKRGRGRPKKSHDIGTEVSPVKAVKEDPPAKRQRGRPKKVQ